MKWWKEKKNIRCKRVRVSHGARGVGLDSTWISSLFSTHGREEKREKKQRGVLWCLKRVRHLFPLSTYFFVTFFFFFMMWCRLQFLFSNTSSLHEFCLKIARDQGSSGEGKAEEVMKITGYPSAVPLLHPKPPSPPLLLFFLSGVQSTHFSVIEHA